MSRLSLGFTAALPVGDMPNIIVLPQATYHLVRDYKTLRKIMIEEIDGDNKKESTDYELTDCPVDKDIDVFDGGGIATPEVFEQIKKALHLSYDVDFAIIRGYGIGIKGHQSDAIGSYS